MTGEITPHWEGIEEQKARILARVEALDESSQKTAPNSRVWAPLQILHHLVLFEQEYLHHIEEGEKQGVSAKQSSRSLMIPLLTWIMRTRISVPTMPTMEPSPLVKPLAELTAEWSAVREKLREKFANVDPKTPLALNPLLGPLTVLQMLPLIAAHQDYHLQQIPRR